MTVRLSVKPDSSENSSTPRKETKVCCPRCVGGRRFDAAPDLSPTISEYSPPISVIEGPAPDRESVPSWGWYCESHDVLLPQGDNDATADDRIAIDEWLALPIRTDTGQRLLALVRESESLGTTESGNADTSSDGERGE
jgi:hypothetical protein